MRNWFDFNGDGMIDGIEMMFAEEMFGTGDEEVDDYDEGDDYDESDSE